MAKHTTEGYTVTWNGTSVAGLTGLPWPPAERGEIDVTDFDSTGVETLPALSDGGVTQMVCIYNPDDAGQQALFDNYALGDGTTQQVVITAPSSSTSLATAPTLTFDAYVQSQQVTGDVNNRAEVTFSLRVQGDPTYTDPTT